LEKRSSSKHVLVLIVLLSRADLSVDILLGVVGCMFGEQDAWVEGFCISQTDPESGTDMERVTGGKRLC